MLYTTQCTNPRELASGSSKISAKLCVPAGGSVQSSCGDLLAPVHPNSAGIVDPSVNPDDVNVNGISVSVGINAGSGEAVMAGSTSISVGCDVAVALGAALQEGSRIATVVIAKSKRFIIASYTHTLGIWVRP
jgi:hypothetical protein